MGDAATIAVVGVVVVMAALTILMMAIMVINRLVPGNKGAKTSAVPEDLEGESCEKESVAAIALAVALAMVDNEATLNGRGTQSTAPGHEVSRWASAGRERLMRSRRKTGRKWGRLSR